MERHFENFAFFEIPCYATILLCRPSRKWYFLLVPTNALLYNHLASTASKMQFFSTLVTCSQAPRSQASTLALSIDLDLSIGIIIRTLSLSTVNYTISSFEVSQIPKRWPSLLSLTPQSTAPLPPLCPATSLIDRGEALSRLLHGLEDKSPKLLD